MKQYILSLFTIFLCTSLSAQIQIPGIVVGKFNGVQTGDTVTVLGALVPGITDYNISNKKKTTHYYVKLKKSPKKIGPLFKTVPKEKIILQDEGLNYWEHIWFEYCGFRHAKSGWNNGTRKSIKNETNRVLNAASLGGGILVDPYIQDYLEGLVHSIFPDSLIRNPLTKIKPVIVYGDLTTMRTYNSGLIFIPVKELISIKHENELIRLLALEISHLILEHGLLNMKIPGMLVENSPKFSLTQAIIASQIAENFLNHLKKKETPIDTNKDSDHYARIMSSLIMEEALNQSRNENYKKALEQIDRLITAEIASDETYLLKAIIYRKLYRTKEANLAALSYLVKAEKLKVHYVSEINREKGLLLIRLNKIKEAKNAFEDYLLKLMEIGDSPNDIKWARDMVFKCDRMLLQVK